MRDRERVRERQSERERDRVRDRESDRERERKREGARESVLACVSPTPLPLGHMGALLPPAAELCGMRTSNWAWK